MPRPTEDSQIETRSPAQAHRYEALRASCLLAGLFVVTQSVLTRHSFYSENYLFGDESQNFLVADALLHGKVLFKDVFYVYGYLSAYSYALAAYLFGNSIHTYLHFLQFISIVSIMALYALLRGFFSGGLALLTTVLVVIPQMLPGSLLFIPDNTYHPLETTLMALCVLLWRPAEKQSKWRAFGVGIVLGLWQGVKFGGALIFGMAIIAAELVVLWRNGFSRTRVLDWLKKSSFTLLGFLLVESVWCTLAFASMPPEMAGDVLFPAYMLNAYEGVINSADRYPHFISWRYFMSFQLAPIAGLSGAIWFSISKKPWQSASHSGGGKSALLLLPIFFVIASFFYFKQVWLYYAYAWCLSIGGVYFLAAGSRCMRCALVAVWLCGFAAFVKNGLWADQKANLVELALPNGEMLWVDEPIRRKVQHLLKLVEADPQTAADDSGFRRTFFFYTMGAGMHAFYGIPHLGRSYWLLPGVVRPYDEPEIAAALEHTKYWVVLLQKDSKQAVTTDLNTWDEFSIKPFSPALRAKISSRLKEPLKIDETTFVFPVKDKP